MLKIKFYRQDDCRAHISDTWINRFKSWLLHKLNKSPYWHVNIEIEDQGFDMFAGTSFRPRSKRVLTDTYGYPAVTYDFFEGFGDMALEMAHEMRESGDIELGRAAWDVWRGKEQTIYEARRSCVSCAVLVLMGYGLDVPPMVMSIDELQKFCEENRDGRLQIIGATE